MRLKEMSNLFKYFFEKKARTIESGKSFRVSTTIFFTMFTDQMASAEGAPFKGNSMSGW